MGKKESRLRAEESPRKHFWMTPNIVDEMGLSVDAFRLYGHYKRLVSETHEHVVESVRESARRIGMSKDRAYRALDQLEEKELVRRPKTGNPFTTPEIIITDIWESNVSHYEDTGVALEGHDVSHSQDTLYIEEEIKNKDSLSRKTERRPIDPAEIEKDADVVDVDKVVREFFANDPLRSELWTLVKETAELNKTKKMSVSRMYNGFVKPIEEAREKFSDEAIRFGLTEAARLEKYDVRYALAVMRRNPDGPSIIVTTNGASSDSSTATPKEAVEMISNHATLYRYAGLTRSFDFTSSEQPPWKIYNELGGDDQERWRNLTAMQSISRRATRDAKA